MEDEGTHWEGDVMKKHLGIILAALLCAGCLGLAACGGSSSQGQSDEGSGAESAPAATSEAVAPEADTSSAAEPAAPAAEADTSTSPEPAAPAAAAGDPSEKFVGSWKLAAASTQGVTVTGDFNQIDLSIGALELAADGTGTVNLNGENISFAWKPAGDNAIEIVKGAAEEDASDMPAAQILCDEHGALVIPLEGEDFEGTMTYTKDGKLEGAKTISAEGAKPVTSIDGLAGTWVMSGISMGGASMTGEPEALAAIGGYDDPTLVFNEDGTAALCGNDAAWKEGDEGIVLADATVEYPVKSLGDNEIVLDLSSITNMEFLLLFTK